MWPRGGGDACLQTRPDITSADAMVCPQWGLPSYPVVDLYAWQSIPCMGEFYHSVTYSTSGDDIVPFVFAKYQWEYTVWVPDV
jgi:hypothetical protein